MPTQGIPSKEVIEAAFDECVAKARSHEGQHMLVMVCNEEKNDFIEVHLGQCGAPQVLAVGAIDFLEGTQLFDPLLIEQLKVQTGMLSTEVLSREKETVQ